MGKIIRILVAIIVILSFVMLGRNEAAWAADTGSDASSVAAQSVTPDWTRRCNDHERNVWTDCDDDDDDDHGTVKPPRRRVKICKLGSASVGGQATIEVKRLGRGDCVTAFLALYNPHSDPPLPKGTRALSDVLSVKLPKKNALVKVCFAVPPGGRASIYTISRGTWQAVGSVKKGVACTETSKSGTYILLRK